MTRHATRKLSIGGKSGGTEIQQYFTAFNCREFAKRLKRAPLRVFIGQFIRRNPHFISDIKRLLDATPLEVKIKTYDLLVAGELAKKYGVFAPNWRKVAANEEFLPDVKLLPSVRGFRVIDPAKTTEFEHLLSVRARHFEAGDFDTTALYQIRDTALRFLGSDKTATVSDKMAAMDYLMGGVNPVDGRYPFDNRLLLSVDLNRPRNEIKDVIDKYLDVHLAPTDFRLRRQEWIRYLMVFDLKKVARKNWDEIGALLAEAFPEAKQQERSPSRGRRKGQHPEFVTGTVFDEQRNLERYLKEAEELIDHNYLIYIDFSNTK